MPEQKRVHRPEELGPDLEVAAMLMKATKMRAGEGSNHVEVDNILGSIVRRIMPLSWTF